MLLSENKLQDICDGKYMTITAILLRTSFFSGNQIPVLIDYSLSSTIIY